MGQNGAPVTSVNPYEVLGEDDDTDDEAEENKDEESSTGSWAEATLDQTATQMEIAKEKRKRELSQAVHRSGADTYDQDEETHIHTGAGGSQTARATLINVKERQQGIGKGGRAKPYSVKN
ncbi:hypothetical protein R1sor_010524 [Riccia sorocarpa]|uniref:Uncharacterized protein n=1 Tax=Riccia sorocarpa TaxID=122646 RepID=A0ABD3HYC7_9MARC